MKINIIIPALSIVLAAHLFGAGEQSNKLYVDKKSETGKQMLKEAEYKKYMAAKNEVYKFDRARVEQLDQNTEDIEKLKKVATILIQRLDAIEGKADKALTEVQSIKGNSVKEVEKIKEELKKNEETKNKLIQDREKEIKQKDEALNAQRVKESLVLQEKEKEIKLQEKQKEDVLASKNKEIEELKKAKQQKEIKEMTELNQDKKLDEVISKVRKNPSINEVLVSAKNDSVTNESVDKKCSTVKIKKEISEINKFEQLKDFTTVGKVFLYPTPEDRNVETLQGLGKGSKFKGDMYTKGGWVRDAVTGHWVKGYMLSPDISKVMPKYQYEEKEECK